MNLSMKSDIVSLRALAVRDPGDRNERRGRARWGLWGPLRHTGAPRHGIEADAPQYLGQGPQEPFRRVPRRFRMEDGRVAFGIAAGIDKDHCVLAALMAKAHPDSPTPSDTCKGAVTKLHVWQRSDDEELAIHVGAKRFVCSERLTHHFDRGLMDLRVNARPPAGRRRENERSESTHRVGARCLDVLVGRRPDAREEVCEHRKSLVALRTR